MAISRPSAGIEAISGCLGGNLARTRGKLPVWGRRSTRKRAPSPLQVAHRQVWAELAGVWRALADAERQAWNAWAIERGANVGDVGGSKSSGFACFMAYAVAARAAGLAPLAEPGNPGTGVAEVVIADLWANVEAGTLTVSMLLDMELWGPEPSRCIALLSPGAPNQRRHNPRTWSPVMSWDPFNVQPQWGVSAITVPLPSSRFDRPFDWGATRSVNGWGSVSVRAEWPLETTPPGHTWAFRVHPVAEFLSPQSIEVTPTEIRFYIVIPGTGPYVDVYSLTSGPTATIGGLVDAINDTSPWRTRGVNSAVLTRPSTDIQVMPRSSRTVRTQPALLYVPA